MSREAVWIAMADLFLDTEVRWFLPAVAGAAVREGYDWPETRRILEREVAPVLAPNLLSVAGEWAGWDEQWLVAAIRKGAGLGGKGLAFATRGLMGDLRAALEALHLYLSSSQANLPGGRSHRVEEEQGRLTQLAALYLENSPGRAATFWSNLRALARWPMKVLESSFDLGLEPVYSRLMVHPDDPPPEKARSNWEAVQGLLGWLPNSDLPTEETIKALENLSYLYLIDDLATCPRGPMVRDELEGWDLELLWGAPLEPIYGRPDYLERNRRALFASSPRSAGESQEGSRPP